MQFQQSTNAGVRKRGCAAATALCPGVAFAFFAMAAAVRGRFGRTPAILAPGAEWAGAGGGRPSVGFILGAMNSPRAMPPGFFAAAAAALGFAACAYAAPAA